MHPIRRIDMIMVAEDAAINFVVLPQLLPMRAVAEKALEQVWHPALLVDLAEFRHLTRKLWAGNGGAAEIFQDRPDLLLNGVPHPSLDPRELSLELGKLGGV